MDWSLYDNGLRQERVKQTALISILKKWKLSTDKKGVAGSKTMSLWIQQTSPRYNMKLFVRPKTRDKNQCS